MKTASIEIIADILPHNNADSLELAKVLGWQSVVKKGQFTKGERVVFIPIDTILPDAPWSSFLKKGDKPVRLNTIKLRGEYSQGLIQPISILPVGSQGWNVGADVGAELGVKKYEKELPACLSGEVKCAFPSFLAPRTDEDNGLSNPELVKEVLKYDCTVTRKLDGSSCTIIVENGEIVHVCSRNLSLKENDNNAMWKVTKELHLNNFSGVIQGELLGPGVQGNQLKLLKPQLFIFQIRLGSQWLQYDEMVNVAKTINGACVDKILQFNVGEHSINTLQAFADLQTLPSGQPAEGIVVRPTNQMMSGIGRPLGFKIINRNFKD